MLNLKAVSYLLFKKERILKPSSLPKAISKMNYFTKFFNCRFQMHKTKGRDKKQKKKKKEKICIEIESIKVSSKISKCRETAVWKYAECLFIQKKDKFFCNFQS